MLIGDMLDALKARLEVIDGLVVTTDPAATTVVPMAVVVEDEVSYDESFGRGGAQVTVIVTVYVSTADSPEGIGEARLYLSPHGDRSIRAAIEATTDGVVMAVSAKTGQAGKVDRDGGSFYAARFEVQVRLSNPNY